MALRTQIAPDDCVEQYEKAAVEHQDAGLMLLYGGSAQGIAMMALSAEMFLKAAYFRFIGYPSGRSIERVDLKDAEADIQSLGVSEPPQGYHNLVFWAEALITLHQNGLLGRMYNGRAYAAVASQPMPGADEIQLRQCAVRLATNWEIGDRYKSLSPHANKQDMEDVFDDAIEIKHLYDQGRI